MRAVPDLPEGLIDYLLEANVARFKWAMNQDEFLEGEFEFLDADDNRMLATPDLTAAVEFYCGDMDSAYWSGDVRAGTAIFVAGCFAPEKDYEPYSDPFHDYQEERWLAGEDL